MPAPPSQRPWVSQQPGSADDEIAQEPDWDGHHDHRIGYKNRQGRFSGLTHSGDHEIEDGEERKFVEQAVARRRQLLQKSKSGHLINFQDVMHAQTDFHRRRPGKYPPGWRFVVRNTEGWIKEEQDWPANIKRREKEEQKKKEEEENQKQKGEASNSNGQNQEAHHPEHDWRRSSSREAGKHNGAYGNSEAQMDRGARANGDKSEYERLREKYTPEEITLLRNLQNERDLTASLQQNAGDQESPVKTLCENAPIGIDPIDAMTPDNWIPRSTDLIRRTGQHPLNAEPTLKAVFEAGLITPNQIHYVRNHGSVPRLYWDTHVLDICDGTMKLSMDYLRERFESINIAVALACDGNRRGELNLIKKSKGFDWGPGAVSCAYWKGALLYQVLEAAGVTRPSWNASRKWVNFEGADEPSEGKYATSLPLDYVLDRANDVLLAYEMNNTMLPSDHGFPVRLLVPGFVGGRSIKWLARIWITDHENESHYHIWDNRVLPAFISEKDGEFAETMFKHPSTACNEQNLNSVIVRPAQGEKLTLVELLKEHVYRVQGYAYDGGGHEVQRVEVSLDEGETWLYCIRTFPDRPIRNGNKFWTWLHWHVDVESAHLIRASSITVRCFNVFKNTQPERPVWNVMGMMNNGWYKVKLDTTENDKLKFRHPFDQEGNEGWMKPSTENQLAAAKQSSGVPEKQFTRQEIEKHASKDDCWLVINGNVYDATSVLAWHPGGSATLLANAGCLSLDVTTSFESVHDDYAHKKLQECAVGKVTDKAMRYMKKKAEADAEAAAKSGSDSTFLNSKKWVPVQLTKKKQISKDTLTYTFTYQDAQHKKKLGLGTCQHIQFGIHMLDKMLIRSYTPTHPITVSDEDGTFDLTVKSYLPDKNQPGGAFSNFLYTMNEGEEVDVCGPTGEIVYLGNGKFNIEGRDRSFKRVSLVLGGSGITPGYSLIERIVGDESDETKVRVVNANKTEDDILLRDSLDQLVKKGKGKLQLTHVLSHPKEKDKWEKTGVLSGHVNVEIIKNCLFEPDEESVAFLCGPPGMIQKAALPALKDWGYKEDENCFGF